MDDNSWNQTWILVGAHPIRIPKTPVPLDLYVVQRGRRLHTVLQGEVVKVTYLESTGDKELREIGTFPIRAADRIGGDIEFEGSKCHFELILSDLGPRGLVLSGLFCPPKPHGPLGEEGAIGGFTAEAQGGDPEGDRGA